MKKNWKGSTGKITLFNREEILNEDETMGIESDTESIILWEDSRSQLTAVSSEVELANAELFIDSLNTIQESDMLPSEVWKKLQEATDIVGKFNDHFNLLLDAGAISYGPTKVAIRRSIKAGEALIKKCSPKPSVNSKGNWKFEYLDVSPGYRCQTCNNWSHEDYVRLCECDKEEKS